MSKSQVDSDHILVVDPIWPAAVALDATLDERAQHRWEPATRDNEHLIEQHALSIDGGSHGPSTRELLDIADRLRSRLEVEPRPDFAFALRESLLPANAVRPKTNKNPTPVGPALGALPLPYRPTRDRLSVVRIAAVLTLALLLFAGFSGDSMLTKLAGDDRDLPLAIPALDRSSATSHQGTNCTVAPVDLKALATTVGIATVTPQDSAPVETAVSAAANADAITTRAVRATIEEWVACGNDGDVARGLALFTTDLVLRLFSGETEVYGWDVPFTSEPATPRPESEPFKIGSLSDVKLLPDGRASVAVTITVDDRTDTSPPLTLILTDTGDRWLISDLIVPEEGTPTASGSIEVQAYLDLRTSAAFAARIADQAAPGSTLNLLGPGEVIDGILWVPVNGLTGGLGPDQTYYLPAAYLIATGARIPGIPVPSTAETGTPHPSECTIEPIALADIASFMGPARSSSPRSAMALLATIGSDAEFARSAVVATLRELYACHNAGSYTQSVALNTQNFYQHAGATAYRPIGTESDLATARPLPEENRSEILAIGAVHHLDDGRVGVVVIGASHDDPIQVGSTFFILARSGDRWLIDDAIPIDSSARPGGDVTPTSPVELTPTPTAGPVAARAQPTFPIGATVNVRGNTINLHSLPRSNAEVIARLGPCACAMEVFGPMADSGDALWLPVTDLATGVSGYVSLESVLPPEHTSRAGFQVGQTVITTESVRLRGVPEPSDPADPDLPIGTPLKISAITISSGHLWVRVNDPNSNGTKWVPWDLLLSATTSNPPPSTPAATPQTSAPAFAIGQQVSVTTDAVSLRDAPGSESHSLEILMVGDQLEIIGTGEDMRGTVWYPVKVTATGQTGFFSSAFLQADGS